MKKKILLVAGARPNFIKAAPLLRELKKYRGLRPLLVHTGQHYDFRMSDVFFRDLKISKPDICLGVGSGTHAAQTAGVMAGFERVLLKEKPALVVVVGDVNSTMACALAASKLKVKIAHVEAGLRSFDRTMPEETNRVVTDRLADALFVTEASGLQNLKREGIDSGKVYFTGNVMIDSLLTHFPWIKRSDILKRLRLKSGGYAVLTLHRPDNVDSKESLTRIYRILKDVTEKIRIVYPIHPRSRKMIQKFGLQEPFYRLEGLQMIAPLGYLDFMKLLKESRLVMTDSGGIQEEAAALGIPCLTLRDNTERPVTIGQGSNVLVGLVRGRILREVEKALRSGRKMTTRPKFWDGHAARRIGRIIQRMVLS